MSARILLLLLTAATQGSVLIGCVALAAFALRRASADLRHNAWTAALAVQVILLPLAAAALVPAALRVGVPAFVEPWVLETASGGSGYVDVVFTGAGALVAPIVVALWAIGAAVVLSRIGWGWFDLRRARSVAHEITNPAARQLLERLAGRLGVAPVPALVAGDRFETPATWGLRRAVIVVPSDFDQWPDELQSATFAHELAHVARRDTLSQAIGQLACALAWPNPLVWWAARAARRECEHACDDVALSLGAMPSQYAMHLVGVASGGPRGTWPRVELSLAHAAELERRALAILSADTRRSSPRAARVAATVGVALAGAVVSTGRLAANPPPAGNAGFRCAPTSGPVLNLLSRDTSGRSVWQGLWEGRGCHVDWRAVGRMRFGGDRASIVGLEAGARFRVSEEAGRERRTAELRALDDRRVEVRWIRDGAIHAFNDDASRWLGGFLANAARALPVGADGWMLDGSTYRSVR